MQGDQYNYDYRSTGGNPENNRNYYSQPRTIAELEGWYRDRNLPPYETTRFFIGINYTGARAFGIYQEGNEFIVYKNKDDGSRAIRYQGPDEAFAVNELYLKLKSEIMARKNPNSSRSSGSGRGAGSYSGSGSGRGAGSYAGSGFGSRLRNGGISKGGYWIFGIGLFYTICTVPELMRYKLKLFALLLIVPTVIFFVIKSWTINRPHDSSARFKKNLNIGYYVYLGGIVFLWIVLAILSKNPHYYKYNDDVYCKYSGNYYRYSSSMNDYYAVSRNDVPTDIIWNAGDYDYDDEYRYDSTYSFTDSGYYERVYDTSNDYSFSNYSSGGSDYDYDWDSGSNWNSGGTNWSSDW